MLRCCKTIGTGFFMTSAMVLAETLCAQVHLVLCYFGKEGYFLLSWQL
jgi:hypothetical protein